MKIFKILVSAVICQEHKFTSIEFFVLFNEWIKLWSGLIYFTINFEHCKLESIVWYWNT